MVSPIKYRGFSNDPYPYCIHMDMIDASKCGEFCQMTMQMKETRWLTNIYWTWKERIPKLKANHSVLVGNPRKSMLKSRHMPIPSIPPLLYFADLHRWSHSIIWALYNYILIYLDLIQCPLTEWLLDQPVPGQSDDKPRSCHLGQDRHVCLVPFKTISIIPNRSQGTQTSYNPLSKSLVTRWRVERADFIRKKKPDSMRIQKDHRVYLRKTLQKNMVFSNTTATMLELLEFHGFSAKF